jgi:nucleolin
MFSSDRDTKENFLYSANTTQNKSNKINIKSTLPNLFLSRKKHIVTHIMSGEDLSNKIVATLKSSNSSLNVKKLRKQILLQLQTDSDDKEAKKKFKKAVQKLEADGILSLNKDGEISLISQKVHNNKAKESKKDKKKKDKKKKESRDVSNGKRKNSTLDENEDLEGEEVEEKRKSGTNKKRQKLEDGMKSSSEEDEGVIKEERGDDEDDHDEQDEENTVLLKDTNGKNVPCPGNPSGCTRLFLGNLPFAVDEASLRTFLDPAEMTHVKWITDKETGKFYGSAFIEVATSKCGAIAVKKKNGEKLMGRPIRINFAPARESDVWPPKSKEVTGNGGQAGGSGVKAMGVKPDNCVKLFIGNLSFDIDDDAIIKFFASVDAEVKAVRWLHHRDTGDFKGCGYVEFWNTEACEKGAALNGKSLMGRPIRIDWTD